MLKRLIEHIDSICERDPAARSRLEVLFCYPGLHAIIWHRVANWFWRNRMFFIGRFLSHIGRMLTGIEIHPGAKIGRRVFIDHGMGCVIGETAEVGDDVTLYHGITLGGISLAKGKRHPTLEDHVIVGAGAQVLGPITVRRGARIGANAVVLAEVPPGVTMVGIPAKQIMPRERTAEAPRFTAYGTPEHVHEMADPGQQVIKGLHAEIAALRAKLEALEADLVRTEAEEPRPAPAPARRPGVER
jgi:serine O-acetyltransferase